ncbi:MAG: hypothetical protein R3280_10565 [Marinobacter sp.]|uniref:hypothetical protein n=1 Tax=Marinobacter sp. TaxID=50741 RepID=UPI00299D252B|nr:hypothetical protein [Marinobacter sp.]MDX1635072.1 hypothetical protein [Marinobacter sp.]
MTDDANDEVRAWRQRLAETLPDGLTKARHFHRRSTRLVAIDSRQIPGQGPAVVTFLSEDGREHWLDVSASVALAQQRAMALGWTVIYQGRDPTEVERYLNQHIPRPPQDPDFPTEVLRAIKLRDKPVLVRESHEAGERQVVVTTQCDYWLKTFDHYDEAYAFIRDHALKIEQ